MSSSSDSDGTSSDSSDRPVPSRSNSGSDSDSSSSSSGSESESPSPPPAKRRSAVKPSAAKPTAAKPAAAKPAPSRKRRRQPSSSDDSSSSEEEEAKPAKKRKKPAKKRKPAKKHKKRARSDSSSEAESSSGSESDDEGKKAKKPIVRRPLVASECVQTDAFVKHRADLLQQISAFVNSRSDGPGQAKNLQNIFRLMRQIPCDSTKPLNSQPFVSSASAAPPAAAASSSSKAEKSKKPDHCRSCKKLKQESLKDGVCSSCVKAAAHFGIPLVCTICDSRESLSAGGLCPSCDYIASQARQGGLSSSGPAAAAPAAAAPAAAPTRPAAAPAVSAIAPTRPAAAFPARPAATARPAAAALSARPTSAATKPKQKKGGPASSSRSAVRDSNPLESESDDEDNDSLASDIRAPVRKEDMVKWEFFTPLVTKQFGSERPNPFQLDMELGAPVARGQKENATIIKANLESVGFSIDSSFKGTGKSVVAVEVGYDFEMIFYITPVGGVRMDHLNAARAHGCGVADALTYSTLTGRAGHGTSHGWLVRKDVKTERYKQDGSSVKHAEVSYEPTQKLIELIKRHKVLFVLDEVHKARNKTSPRSLALATMFSLIFNSATGKRHPGVSSAVLLQSGTLFNRREQVIAILQMIGQLPSVINNSCKLFTVGGRKKDRLNGDVMPAKMQLSRCQGFFDSCMALDPVLSKSIYRRYITYPKELPSTEPLAGDAKMTTSERGALFLYNLFVLVVQRKYGSSMPIYMHPGFSIKNTFYCFDNAEDQMIYNEAVEGLRSQHRLQEQNRAHGRRVDMMSVLAKQQFVDSAKVVLLIRAVRTALEADPHCKVFIPVNYNKDIERIVAAFASYRPLVLSGQQKLSENDRGAIQRLFQEAQYETVDGVEVLQDRILVANGEMACEGINLQDTSPDSRNHRWAFGMPSCHGIRCDQLTARIHRFGLGPNAKINFRWVYGRTTMGQPEFDAGTTNPSRERAEEEILERLANRSQVLKEVSSFGGQRDSLNYAIDYEQEIELTAGGRIVPISKLHYRMPDAVDLTDDADDDVIEGDGPDSGAPASSSAAAAAASHAAASEMDEEEEEEEEEDEEQAASFEPDDMDMSENEE